MLTTPTSCLRIIAGGGAAVEEEEEAIATYYADNQRHRALVFRLPGDSYRVDVERLYEAEDAGGLVRGVFWSRLYGLTSYSDDLNRALQLAQENLRCGEGADH
jgi:hypothetical protein